MQEQNEQNELNDIILNKGGSTGDSKKIILAVATLGIVLIIVVILMSTLAPDAKENLPQPIPLPTQSQSMPLPQDEPLFEEIVVVEETPISNDNLDNIAQRLKQESMQKAIAKKQEPVKKKPVKVTPKKQAPKKVVATKKEIKKATETRNVDTVNVKAYYVQVGSFSKYQPNKKFLDSIVNQGYKYKFHKVIRNSKPLNKVLVGPFYKEKEARAALRVLRSNLEAGSFLVRF